MLPRDICATNRGNMPPAINDTGVFSATLGMYDTMMRVILARRIDGKIAAGGGDVFCVCQSERVRNTKAGRERSSSSRG